MPKRKYPDVSESPKQRMLVGFEADIARRHFDDTKRSESALRYDGRRCRAKATTCADASGTRLNHSFFKVKSTAETTLFIAFEEGTNLYLLNP